MLYYCAYTWHSHTNAQQVRRRLLELHAAGTIHPERFRGWYSLAGGGSGFLVYETDDPREVTAALQPWMDLMSWDVRAIYPLDYDAVIQTAQQLEQQGS